MLLNELRFRVKCIDTDHTPYVKDVVYEIQPFKANTNLVNVYRNGRYCGVAYAQRFEVIK